MLAGGRARRMPASHWHARRYAATPSSSWRQKAALVLIEGHRAAARGDFLRKHMKAAWLEPSLTTMAILYRLFALLQMS